MFDALYVYSINCKCDFENSTFERGEVLVVMCTHVDDLLWAHDVRAKPMIDKILKRFIVGDQETRNFRYCGKEIQQDSNFDIHITCRDTSRRLKPIHISAGRAKQLSEDATSDEKS